MTSITYFHHATGFGYSPDHLAVLGSGLNQLALTGTGQRLGFGSNAEPRTSGYQAHRLPLLYGRLAAQTILA